jgi:phosphomannomutase
MAEPIISVSGLRGIIGTELTPRIAMDYAAAFASTLPCGSLVIGRDGRTTGSMLADAVAASLAGYGMQVFDADVISTPSLGVLVRETQAVGGIQISASHNPPAYNGMKLFNREGRVIPAAAGMRVLDAYRSGIQKWASHESIKPRQKLADPHAPHLERVLATIDVDKVKGKGFRVLLDSNHGAGALLGKRLLDSIGCEVEILGEHPDGLFEHPPEPIADNLRKVSAIVRERNLQVGFCQDPDADRLAIIDEQGNYIGEEFTSVLCAWGRLEKKKGPLVTNCASSSMMEWLSKQYGVAFSRSKVGEANVVDRMLEMSAVYGGEGSGGPIDPEVGYVRDSFVGMAQVLDLMSITGLSVSQLVAKLPKAVMIKDKIALAETDRPNALAKLRQEFGNAIVDDQDGLRFDWPDRWLLMRGSNTEPIVRIIVEAPTEKAATELCERAKAVLGA